MSKLDNILLANCLLLIVCIAFLIAGIIFSLDYASMERWNKEAKQVDCLIRNITFKERYCGNSLCWTPILDLQYGNNVKNVSLSENILIYDNIEYYQEKYKPGSNIKCYYNEEIFLSLYKLDNFGMVFFFSTSGWFLIYDIIASIYMLINF